MLNNPTKLFSAECGHAFTKVSSRPHYCTYIQVPSLMETFPNYLKTIDDFLLYSFVSSSVLWFNLIQCNLRVIEKFFLSFDISYLTSGAHYQTIKHLQRINTALEIILMQSDIVRNYVIRRPAQCSFVLKADISDIPLLLSLIKTTHHLFAHLPSDLTLSDDQQPSYNEWRCLSSTVSDQLESVHTCFIQLFDSLKKGDDSLPVYALNQFISLESIVHPALVTLEKHHPQALLSSSNYDELTFINSHQAFELWFPTMLISINHAVDILMRPTPILKSAECVIRRIAVFMQLFGKMIKFPQTMTAQDYILFRPQIRGGSGAESIGFRLMEVALGQRDPHLLSYLKKMNLMTDIIEVQLARPSLYEAFLHLLKKRDILAEDDTDSHHRLLAILKITDEINEHADIVWLSEAMLDVEQTLDKWRLTHLAMVDRMIGQRPSLGIAGNLPKEGASACPYASDYSATEARPYLLQTLNYQRMFPILWEVRSHLKEV